MGITEKNPVEADKFYADLNKCYKDLKGIDAIVVGDFNAKLGKKSWDDNKVHVGLHARELRIEDGENLQKFLADNSLLASNTFFCHKACHITTYENKSRQHIIFNQIDYILKNSNRKHSMINARSFKSLRSFPITYW